MSLKEIFIHSCEINNNVEDIYRHVAQLKTFFNIFESEDNEDYKKIVDNKNFYYTYKTLKKSILQFDNDYLYENVNYMGYDNVFQYHYIHEKLYGLCVSLK